MTRCVPKIKSLSRCEWRICGADAEVQLPIFLGSLAKQADLEVPERFAGLQAFRMIVYRVLGGPRFAGLLIDSSRFLRPAETSCPIDKVACTQNAIDDGCERSAGRFKSRGHVASIVSRFLAV